MSEEDVKLSKYGVDYYEGEAYCRRCRTKVWLGTPHICEDEFRAMQQERLVATLEEIADALHNISNKLGAIQP